MHCVPSQPKRPRCSIEAHPPAPQQPNRPVPALRARKRMLCNELVFEVCKGIPMIETSDKILVTAMNMNAYLTGRFRKKLVYRAAIAFIVAKLKEGSKLSIHVNQRRHRQGMIHTHQSDVVFAFQTDHLSILVFVSSNPSAFCIAKNESESEHVHLFVRLVAPLLRPIAANLFILDQHTLSKAVRFLNPLRYSIDRVELSAEQFLALSTLDPNTRAALNECRKLSIEWTLPGSDQRQQLRRSIIQWLKAGNDQPPKLCKFSHYCHNELALLLAEIKADFYGATSMHSFAVRICVSGPTYAGPFNVHNSAGEQLELGQKEAASINDTQWFNYTLIRRPISELLDHNKSMELDFDGIGMTNIFFV